jgi:hypothetical protein
VTPILPLLLILALGAPEFSVERGLMEAPFTLDVQPSIGAEGGTSILYSLDGSAPTLPWTGSLLVEDTAFVRAREVSAEGELGDVATHTYLFIADVLADPAMDPTILADPIYGPAVERTLRALPSVSLVLGTPLEEYEQAVSFEWIDPTGLTLQEDCGVAKVGGASLRYAKNNLRLYFRERYGAGRLRANLYEGFESGLPPTDSLDALTLRSGSHDSVFWLEEQGQYLRNRWMDETQLAMGHLSPHGRYVHLYVDGAYRGLYQARERFGAAFLAEYRGGNEDEYETVNGGRTSDGSGVAWAQVMALMDSYEAVQPWLDVTNFIDYMLLQYYAANDWDWSHNHNWMASGPSAPGAGGYIFHSSDSDVCLVYDWATNILDNPGPGRVFGALIAEAHPDFMMLLGDRIHRHFEGDGALTPVSVAARYGRLAATIEDAVVAESARWGGGWWQRDDEWRTERSRLDQEFFPRRTIAMLQQVRDAGWYPLDAPGLDVPWSDEALGLVDVDARVEITVLPAFGDRLWVRTDGGDPRLPGGAVASEAEGPEVGRTIAVTHTMTLRARSRLGDVWSPLAEVFVEVDESPPLVLNEWNAVAEDRELRGEGTDDAWGRVPGNGGDWIELVVIEDHLDVRGWRLVMEDRNGPVGDLRFTDAPLLEDLRAGTIVTIAEDLPEDPAYDPENGDWRFHLRVAAEGALIVGDGFDVTHQGWRFTLLDDRGRVRFGPVGEGIGATTGISSREVGLLAMDPGRGVRRWEDWRGGNESTFGAPNRWGDQRQRLGRLRPDFPREPTPAPPEAVEDEEDGCIGAGPAIVAMLLIAPLGLRRRRGAIVFLVLAFGCATTSDDDDATSPPENLACLAPEVCDGRDNDCDGLVDDADPDLTDGLPFFVDEDGDGWGGDRVIVGCTLGPGAALRGGDCDDTDEAVHPQAPESCDGLDRDCDGRSGDALGLSEPCAAAACSDVLEVEPASEDGPYWLELASGVRTRIWCDMSEGGWTLGFLRNSMDVGSQGDFGGAEASVEQLDIAPQVAASTDPATAPRRAWLDLNAQPWTELRVAAYAGGARTFVTDSIDRELLRIRFGEPGYLLYGDAGYWWCGGPADYTDDGIGAVNNPEDAPADCKGHGSLGSGWDLSDVPGVNAGLTLCGGDASSFLQSTWGGGRINYGNPGGAQAIWVR